MIYEEMAAGDRDLPEKFISMEDAGMMFEDLTRRNNRTIGEYLEQIVELKAIIDEYRELVKDHGRTE